MKNVLKYQKPASGWEKGMPLGNGRLGAMLLGNLSDEHIWLNEDTLWSGYPCDYTDPEVYSYLEKVRTLIFQNRFAEADRMINEHMVGTWTESYMPMADLTFQVPETNAPEQYLRELDIQNAVSRITAKKGIKTYRYEAFVSYPDQIAAFRLSCEEGFTGSVSVQLSSQLRHRLEATPDGMKLTGWCPTIVEPDYYPSDDPIRYDSFEETPAIKFQTGLRVRTDGDVESRSDGLCVSHASYVELFVTSANSFLGFDKKPVGEFRQKVEESLENIQPYSWEQLFERHREDFRGLFDRVELDLGHSEYENEDMFERLRRVYEGGEDPELIATAFQFGRYLLISGSREGTQPTNLQGIWNDSIRPKWSSNYTVNINLQMNYWLADVTNLSECNEPLMTFIREISETGRKTAEVNYRCRGWVCHHNVDLWRKTTAVGSRKKDTDVLPWSFWPMAGGWFCEHLWEHYRYTMDEAFLQEQAWPIMKSCAEFYLDFLTEHNGELVTCPSASPENLFVYEGERHGMHYACTMDNAILMELFGNCLEAAKTLGMPEDDFLKDVKHALEKIPPFKIGKYGQIQEWQEDFVENDPEHRHFSPLYGLHPGNLISPEKTPELAKASEVVLARRSAKSTPWGRSWQISLNARLKKGEQAYQEARRFLQPVESNEISYDDGGIFSNLVCARPFQIDGSFGFTEGIAEMLVQSQDGKTELLPAIPKAWKDGYVKGLKIRGNKTVNIRWKDGKITDCLIQ